MKTTILAAAGAALLALAPAAFAPAAFAQDPTPPGAPPPVGARPAGPAGGDWTLKRREDWIDAHINRAHDDKDIDDRQADRAHHALDRIRDDENRMRGRHDGQLTDNETAELESRLDALAGRLRGLRESAFQRPW